MKLEEEITVQTSTSHSSTMTPSEDTAKNQDIVMHMSEKTKPKIV